MAWTAPRTWVADEVATAALMNAHLRDNLEVLKVTRNAAGRIYDLSAATLANLSGANVTGIVKPAGANAFTAGRTRFLGTSRLVVPVGADKYDDLGGGLRRGVWVEGDYLHHIAANQSTEWRYLGAFVSAPAGAAPGSIWVEGEYLHYVDADGDERRCLSYGAGGHADTAAQPGSIWVETYWHWIQETGTQEKPGHADVAHSDGSVHYDEHADVAHSDWHADTGHADSHSDEHSDSHGDAHLDKSTGDHQDSHTDWYGDKHGDDHTDTPHWDGHSDSHTDTHTDHNDHGDSIHYDAPEMVT